MSHDHQDDSFSHDEGLQQDHSISFHSGHDPEVDEKVVQLLLIFEQKSVLKNCSIVLFHSLQSAPTQSNFCRFQIHHGESNDGVHIF